LYGPVNVSKNPNAGITNHTLNTMQKTVIIPENVFDNSAKLHIFCQREVQEYECGVLSSR